ncbi:MAG: GLUG motif-containing protein [Sedimentisphaerales bacterium]
MFYTYRKVLVIISIVFCLSPSVFAYSGGSGEPNDPYRIADVNDLLVLAADVNDYIKAFVLINDINLAEYTFSKALIARDGITFNGIFDGNGHSIISLKIDANNSEDFIGLFGEIGLGGIVKNLGIEDVNITGGDNYIGGLCGWNYHGSISNCYSTGNVSGNISTGGLCGWNYNSSISNCYSTGNVSGNTATGGLCGQNYRGNIIACYSTGNVSGNSYTGGLCGINYNNITSCYSTGIVSGSGNYTGGLCGENVAIISNCYSTGNVSGNNYTGGLCGTNYYKITSCYSTGTINGNGNYTGGLCGGNVMNITNCYSTGNVSGSSYVGGLCGSSYTASGIISCYFLDTTGPDNGLGEPLTDAQMKQQASYTDWDFSYEDGDEADWFIQIDEYPILTWQISPADIYTDGRNNFRDFAVFAQYWMRKDCRVYNDYCDWADLNFDGSVDTDDLIILMSYWLQSGIYE